MMKAKAYHKVTSYEAKPGDVKKCVLLFSGGLDSCIMLKWIEEHYDCEVITLTVNLGQFLEDAHEAKKKALLLGAKKAIVADVAEEFANDYIAKCIKANGDYQGGYHLSTPLGRPLIAKVAVETAIKEGADAIAHGCTGKGNDQVRIDGAVLTLAPHLKVIAPVREWSMGREEEIEYAKEMGIEINRTVDKPYSHDDNIWGITSEGAEIEDPEKIPCFEKVLKVTNLPENAPNEPEVAEIEFEKGVPMGLNGEKMSLYDIIACLNPVAAMHGVGVTVLIEDRIFGVKVRGVYENPAASVLIKAHKALEMLVSTREENEFKSQVDTKWSYLCYGAKWFEPLMENLNAYIDKASQKVTGKVKVKMLKGHAMVVAAESPYSMFSEALATFNTDEVFNQNAAAPFIQLYTLSQQLAHAAQHKVLEGGKVNEEAMAD
jgi:argininosuccinate synthase